MGKESVVTNCIQGTSAASGSSRIRFGFVFWLLLFCVPPAMAQMRAIDAPHSTLRVRAGKTGLFSAMGHEHVIEAPLAEGSVDEKAPAVRLRIESAALRVTDQGISDSDRAEIQGTMLGPLVLDSAKFPDIRFESATVEPEGANHWKVRGNLTLHGQTHPVMVEATLDAGHYRGSASLKQTDFGIKPVSVAGGAVKVKDELRIEFDIAMTP
jgi:polyisoprenoid-binding protein YceI